MALGRLQASLAAATNEVTIAAANINFDSSLFKCEAPKELTLGHNLSQKRREDAEMSPIQVAARKLGALLKDLCPRTPQLAKLYGIRDIEISVASMTNAVLEFVESLLGGYVGLQRTSI